MATDEIHDGRGRLRVVEGFEVDRLRRPTPRKRKPTKTAKRNTAITTCLEKDYEQNQLWLVDVSAALKNFLPVAAKQLTTGSSLNVSSFDWSPDSTRIAFSAAPNPLLAFNGDEDIYLLDLTKNNEVKKIVALPGPDGSPMFSPDGKQLAFGTALAQPYYFYTNGHIAVVDLDAVLAKTATTPADVRDLTAKFDEDPQPDRLGAGRNLFRRPAAHERARVSARSAIRRNSAHHQAGHVFHRRRFVHEGFQDDSVHEPPTARIERTLRLSSCGFFVRASSRT